MKVIEAYPTGFRTYCKSAADGPETIAVNGGGNRSHNSLKVIDIQGFLTNMICGDDKRR
jgi:hypothetical protein